MTPSDLRFCYADSRKEIFETFRNTLPKFNRNTIESRRNALSAQKMTVTEIAAAAGVSTQAVRGYCRRHFNTSRKGKVWTLSGDDLAEILEHYGIEIPETDSETDTQPGETDGYITMPREVYDDLREELRVKNAQIEALNAALVRAQESGQAAQLLHAADRKDDLVIDNVEQDQQQTAASSEVLTETVQMTRWEHFKAAFGF